LTVLQGDGVYDDDFVRRAYVGHLADIFRATRFGAGEAHGRANLLQLNWLREKGVIRHDAETGRFSADVDALVEGLRSPATELLTLQAKGDYARAGELLERYGTVRPEMQAALDGLDTVPVDIRPHYTVMEKMQGW